MQEKVAVATLDGKAYFFIVNQLREQNIPFISLLPGKPLPAEVKVVITTRQEENKIDFGKKLVFTSETEIEHLINQAKGILLGKEAYEKIIIGVDPGAATGLAIVADGNIIEVENCFSSQEVINCINKIIKNVNFMQTIVTVKIGNGIPLYRDLLEALDEALPAKVALEVVNEMGTNRPIKENRRSRGIRHISSAIRIAGRSGYTFSRTNGS